MSLPRDDQVEQAWIDAADDLGIVAVVPAVIGLGAITVSAPVFLPQFGATHGIVLLAASEAPASDSSIAGALVAHGYAYSYRGLVEPYQRRRFVGLLNDWGWNDSDGGPPDWYEGPSLDADDWS